jgi:hypothetical protein
VLAGAQLTVPLPLAEALQLRELLEGFPKRSKFSYTTLPGEGHAELRGAPFYDFTLHLQHFAACRKDAALRAG